MVKKRGKSIRLAVVAAKRFVGRHPACRDLTCNPAQSCGSFDKESNEAQARQIGEAWEKLGDQKRQFNLKSLPIGDKPLQSPRAAGQI